MRVHWCQKSGIRLARLWAIYSACFNLCVYGLLSAFYVHRSPFLILNATIILSLDFHVYIETHHLFNSDDEKDKKKIE